MISALIIGSELEHCTTLMQLLQQHCPQVKVADIIHSCAAANQALHTHNPQLIFLDVSATNGDGFDLLEHLPTNHFGVIFISDHEQFAVKAIRFNALGYLIRPIDPNELQEAVTKAVLHQQLHMAQQLETLVKRMGQTAAQVHKVAVPTQQGLQMVDVNGIISCTSDSNYSVLHLKQKAKIVVSRTLKEVEEMLQDFSFVRVHHSHLVNINEIEKYIKGEGGCLVMSDGSQIDVSRSRKEALLHKLLHHKA